MKRRLLFIIVFFTFILQSAFAQGNYNYTPGHNFKSEKADYNNYNERILFIIDFSNSMNEPLTSDRTKLEIALNTMNNIIPRINPNVWVGLRVYGHRTGITPFHSCTASQLISPIQQKNNANILFQLGKIRATGWTPITYSLKQAINSDFANFSGKKHIILLSDGGENCDESPCEYAVQLIKNRDDIQIDVIAFAISDTDANNQLKCVSLVTSGKFYTANSAAKLIESLEDSLNMQKDVKGEIIIKK